METNVNWSEYDGQTLSEGYYLVFMDFEVEHFLWHCKVAWSDGKTLYDMDGDFIDEITHFSSIDSSLPVGLNGE